MEKTAERVGEMSSKQRWESPQIIELDFSETRQEKAASGGDGDPPQLGNLKTGS